MNKSEIASILKNEGYETSFIDTNYLLVYNGSRTEAYLFQYLSDRFFKMNDMSYRFVGILVDYFKITLSNAKNIQLYFNDAYLLNPVLYDMEILIYSKTIYINKLHQLSDEYMQQEMYEYLFE